MKSTLGLALGSILIYSLNALSDSRPGHPTLNGRWVLVDRSCSSGYAPMDGFILGRDHYEIRIRGHRFQSYLRQAGCEQWIEGAVRRDRRAIHFQVHRANATCPTNFPPEFHYTYEHRDQSLSIFAGPFVHPAACGYGEYLESIFTSSDQHREPPSDDDQLPHRPQE